MMRAAVVSSFSMPPTCRDWPEPVPATADEIAVDVLAAGLHPRVRSQANGSHYSSAGALPLVPGVDGVGRDADGNLRYFILGDTTTGSLAERTVVDRRRSVVLPAATDPVSVAAAMNPAMSSWLALRRRTRIEPGARVAVLGATGNAGRLAVEIARHLGARHVVAAGRDAARLAVLADLGADETVSLAGPADDVARRLGAAAGDADVVLDYLWGPPTAAAMAAVVRERTDRGRPLTWIEIGSVAGPTAEIPSAALRAARLEIVGSGQGSVPTADITDELPALAAAISAGTFRVDARGVALADVAAAWADRGAAQRVVIVP